jgi:hypothetical protein
MADLRSELEVRQVLRDVLAQAAQLPDPTDIVDTSNLYDPVPPPGDLGLPAPPAPMMASLLTLVCRELLGAKIAAQFAMSLLPPDLLKFTTFGPLAIETHARLNRTANRALFEAICKALELDPKKVRFTDPIEHPDQTGAEAFARRLEVLIATGICNRDGFEFTVGQLGTIAQNTTVEKLMSVIIKILAKGQCL